MKSPRRRAREFALQGLYQWHLSGNDLPAIEAHLAAAAGFEKVDRALFDLLLRGAIAEAAEQPHLKARDYFVDIDHPELGRVRNLGAPFKLPASPGGATMPAPLLGQHNDAVYGSLLGLPPGEIHSLRKQGAI